MTVGRARGLTDNTLDPQETSVSPHLIQSAAQAQIEEHLRSAQRRRLAADARARRRTSAAPSHDRRRGLRSLRAVFG
jgi:hypothetical protein